MMNTENLFNSIPSLVEGEDFSQLLNCRNVVIERIVSSDQAKPATFSDRPDNKVYSQEQDEWVILIKGEAQLRINDDIVKLKAGDYLFIPARIPHQVLTTSSNCIWLAVHIFLSNASIPNRQYCSVKEKGELRFALC